jgi:stromal membrane-associated protein
MEAVGNRIANEYWEAKLPPDFDRPDSTDSYQLSTFIRQKYAGRAWAADGPPPGQSAQLPKPPPQPQPQPREAPSPHVSSEITVTEIFGDAAQSPRRTPGSRTQTGVISADRKPGKKLPERLARKLKQQEPHRMQAVATKPPPRKEPASHPALTTLASDSDSDDPFA